MAIKVVKKKRKKSRNSQQIIIEYFVSDYLLTLFKYFSFLKEQMWGTLQGLLTKWFINESLWPQTLFILYFFAKEEEP